MSNRTALLCQYQGRTHLCSVTRGNQSVAVHKGTSYGRRSFAVSGIITWKALSLSTGEKSLSLGQFCSRLKPKLFNRSCYVLSLSIRTLPSSLGDNLYTISLVLYKFSDLLASCTPSFDS